MNEKILEDINDCGKKIKTVNTGDDLAYSVSKLKPDQVFNFIMEFNKNSKENFSTQKLRLLRVESGKVVIINENGKLEQIEITKENARTVLSEIKKKDEILHGASYELRKEILKISQGSITTFEAYTYAVEIPLDSSLDDFLDDPNNWIPERLAIHQEIIDSEYHKVSALSERLGEQEPTIYALRGNTASGKTTAIKTNEIFKKSLDQEGQTSGIISPDAYKTKLKKLEYDSDKQAIGYSQVHEEGTMIARKILQKISSSQFSIIIDKRMKEEKNIRELLKISQELNKMIKILDIDISFEISLVRVLGRKIDQDNSTILFDVVAEGFRGIRQNRLSLLKEVRDNPTIKYYVLYITDGKNNFLKVAEKINGELKITKGKMDELKKILKEDPKLEIDKMSQTIIDDNFIKSIIKKTPQNLSLEIQTTLQKYKDKSLKEALDLHAFKLNED